MSAKPALLTRAMRLPRATRLTLLITAGFAGSATALAILADGPATLQSPLPGWLTVGGLLVSFLLGEVLLMNIEFRRQAHSLTLAAIPLVLGALLLPVPSAVLCRALGAGTALAFQRVRPDKFVFNVAAYAFEAAVDTAVIHLLLGSRTQLDTVAALTTLAVVLVVDQVIAWAVLVVIRLHNGPLCRRDILDVLVPAFVLAGVCTAAAIGVMLLVADGAIGAIVVLIGAAAALVIYRSYLSTTRRHQALELVHDFVSGSAGAESFSDVAQGLLPRIRTLLRANAVDMMIVSECPDGCPAGDNQHVTHVVDSEGGRSSVDHGESATLDWVAMRALDQSEPLLAPRSVKDRAVQGWLHERGYRDAIVVPLPASAGVLGTVTVSGRLGETATFTADDVTLLETLVGHLSVAGTNARMVERLAYDASHDALTGLANRASLGSRIAQPLEPGTTALVVMLDLDRFKEVNDALGHAAGDELLRVVAGRLRSVLPASATVARLGGDEFAAYLPAHVGGERAALDLGARLAAELSLPVSVEEALIAADASIGLALSDGDATGDLLRRADTAMYVAKAGDASVVLYTPDMDRGRVENLALLADLRATLRERPQNFSLYFQPKIDLRSRRVLSAEALVRWNHPELGVIAPDRFIPLAETSGLISQFTPLILAMALQECRRWDRLGVPLSVAVNLSARNVGDPNLPDQLTTALTRAGVAASQLIVEITESSIIAEPHQTMRVLHRLSELGISVSLDDFGTGYSSLSYLHRLPVHEVKIDRSFVQGLSTPESSYSRALITAITSLSSALGLRVVAEGVETADTLDELEQLGCTLAQGYVIARPMPADLFTEWLLARSVENAAVHRLEAV